MSFTRVCCCCYSFRGLEELFGPELDIYLLICNLQDVKHDGTGIFICLGCREFLKEVYRFRVEENEVDETSHNNLNIKTIKDELKPDNGFDENSSKILVQNQGKSDDCVHDSVHSNGDNLLIDLDEKLFHCDNCDYCSKDRQNLARHITKHSIDKPYKCNECSYTTTSKRYLKNHVISRHSDERSFSCDQCDHRSKLRSSLNAHKKTHLKFWVKPFKCGECSYATTTNSYLKLHIRARHSNERPFSCDQCNYRSKRRHQLTSHLITHSKDRDKPFKCSNCSFATSTQRYLKSHTRLRHSKERRFLCDQCNISFKYKSQLAAHKNMHLMSVVVERL